MLMVIAVAAGAAMTPGMARPDGGAATCGVLYEKVALPTEQAAPVPVVTGFGWSPEAQQQMLRVSRILGPEDRPSPDESGKVPESAEKDRDPAVLLPKCTDDARPKRKKRLSDYPMA